MAWLRMVDVVCVRWQTGRQTVIHLSRWRRWWVLRRLLRYMMLRKMRQVLMVIEDWLVLMGLLRWASGMLKEAWRLMHGLTWRL
jgi:hypothetical protein